MRAAAAALGVVSLSARGCHHQIDAALLRKRPEEAART